MMDELNKTHTEFLDLLIKGEHEKCSTMVKNFLSRQISLEELYENIFKAALYDVGELWEHNKISVATEHLASAIVESLLNEHYGSISSKNTLNKKVVFSCIEEELHQIGIKMISDIFEENGWKSYFLGANTPSIELINYVRNLQPDLLALSISIYFHMPMLENLLSKITSEFTHLPVLVGGQAFRHGGHDILQKFKNVIYKSNIEDVKIFIKDLN